MREVMLGAGERSQVPDLIEDAGRGKRPGDVAALQAEAGMPGEMLQISGDPVMKLSSASTSWPPASRRSHKCEPMKPAAPDIRKRKAYTPFFGAQRIATAALILPRSP